MKNLTITICSIVLLFVGQAQADTMTWDDWNITQTDPWRCPPDSYIGDAPETPMAIYNGDYPPYVHFVSDHFDDWATTETMLKICEPGLQFLLPSNPQGIHVRMEIGYFDRYAQLITTGMEETFVEWDAGDRHGIYEFDIPGSSEQYFIVSIEFTDYPSNPYDDEPPSPDYLPYGDYAPYINSISFETTPIPEPATMAVMGLGAFLIRKRR